jgi:hypothetical protein
MTPFAAKTEAIMRLLSRRLMFFEPQKTKLDEEIERTLDSLRNISDPEKYDTILSRLERLYKVKELEKPSRVSPDTWAVIAANLVGIVMIITHEHTNAITTKALSLAIRPRL